MRIYIRHGEKAYKNGNSNHPYPFDPPLTKEGQDNCIAVTDQLYNSFGLPTLIFVSPFLRTRETAINMRNRLKEITGKDVPLLVDRNIGEYLGNHKGKFSFTPETTKLHPLIERNISHFNVRVREHNDTLGALDKESFNFWVVTHGLVIKMLTRFNGCRFSGYPDFLSGIVMDKEISTFGSWKLPYK